MQIELDSSYHRMECLERAAEFVLRSAKICLRSWAVDGIMRESMEVRAVLSGERCEYHS